MLLAGECVHMTYSRVPGQVDVVFNWKADAAGAVTYDVDDLTGVPWKAVHRPVGTYTNAPKLELLSLDTGVDVLNAKAAAMSKTVAETYIINTSEVDAAAYQLSGRHEFKITGADASAQGTVTLTLLQP